MLLVSAASSSKQLLCCSILLFKTNNILKFCFVHTPRLYRSCIFAFTDCKPTILQHATCTVQCSSLRHPVLVTRHYCVSSVHADKVFLLLSLLVFVTTLHRSRPLARPRSSFTSHRVQYISTLVQCTCTIFVLFFK